MEKIMEFFFQDHGKVREFYLQSVKMSNFEKVRENRSWSGIFFLLDYIFIVVESLLKIIQLKKLLPGPPYAFLPP